MKPRCVLCGRQTVPAVLLAGNPVGPKCAARAGLIERAAKEQGSVRFAPGAVRQAKRDDGQTLDLFAQDPA